MKIRFSYNPELEAELMKQKYKIIEIRNPTYKGELGVIFYE